MSEQTIRLGLIGLGVMGRNHLRVLAMLKGLSLAFLADCNEELAEHLGQQHEIPGVGDFRPHLKDVDAIVICTPTVNHAETFLLAAEHGVKHLFVEKPLAATLDDAKLLAKTAKEFDLNVQVGFIERFNPAVQRLKQVLEASGRVINIDFERTNKLSSRILDVDVVSDLMIHDIDLALHLNGPARTVVAHGYSGKQHIDFASALITHDNGRFSRIQSSRITEKKKRTIEATCIDMFVDCDLLRREVLIHRQSQILQEQGKPYTISGIQEAIEVQPQEALLTQLQAFIASCRGQYCHDFPGVQAGLDAIRICSQIQQSLAS
jgi:predicted dehydrogenase